jgi:hypothetical protein
MGDYTTIDFGSYANSSFSQGLQVKSRIGLAAEGGLAFIYKSGGFFVENETTAQYTKVNLESKLYNVANGNTDIIENKRFDNSYLNLQTAFHLGGYYDMGDGIHMIFGVGPYLTYQLSATYNQYGLFDNYEQYMKEGEKKLNFGVSGVFGADINHFRVALYPAFGLTKLQEKEPYKPMGLTLGFTYWFFKK